MLPLPSQFSTQTHLSCSFSVEYFSISHLMCRLMQNSFSHFTLKFGVHSLRHMKIQSHHFGYSSGADIVMLFAFIYKPSISFVMDGILLFIANEIMIRFDEKLHASMKPSDSCLLNTS